MLFAATPEIIPLDNGELILAASSFDRDEADRLFSTLRKAVAWQQDHFRIADRQVPVPRLQAWYGDEGARYAYSGLAFTPLPWIPALQHIREKAEDIAQHSFNSVLANLYRNEHDSVGWHADDERELGPAPVIASVSLGASRRFLLQHKHKKALKFALELHHGDVLVMRGALQQHWFHQIPKEKFAIAERINLTYRTVLTTNSTKNW